MKIQRTIFISHDITSEEKRKLREKEKKERKIKRERKKMNKSID